MSYFIRQRGDCQLLIDIFAFTACKNALSLTGGVLREHSRQIILQNVSFFICPLLPTSSSCLHFNRGCRDKNQLDYFHNVEKLL